MNRQRWWWVLALVSVSFVLSLRADEGVKTPTEAAQLVGKRITVEMEVRSTSLSSDAYFLHSTRYATDKDAFTVVISDRAAKQFPDLTIRNVSAYFKGAKVRVTGEVKLTRGRAEINVDDPKRIKIISAPPRVRPADDKEAGPVKVMELTVRRAGSEEERGTGFDARPGVRLGLLLHLPGKQIVDVAEGSKVARFTDDKGTDLLKDPRQEEPFYELQWLVGKPGPRRAAFLVTRVAPARGATKLNLKATLAVRVGAVEKTAELKNAALRADDRPTAAGPVKVIVPKGQFSEGQLKVHFASDKPVKSVTFLDPAGKELDSRRSDSAGSDYDAKYETSYILEKRVERATIRVTYFDNVEEVKVPLDLSFGLGL